ncbi:pyridoxal 5'-phosphate synthase glutaminase subunit PdxT [Prevotella dentasini]|uniref:pyridoxal 5'-phosphate synthase glutaminase subunit PdxT n=1 Tax=Prevotella dentasini TaxID=589537 RepID=UPI000467FA1C|nr:pyridoxal 5'-phosphate synthase glutaminase subunit PdxT [Prevotella dentasini]
MKIAILSLQGAFIEHARILQRLGAETFEIRQASDWDRQKDALVIPGGESTVILKLLHELNLFQSVRRAIAGGLPVFGTCAGLILLSRHLLNPRSPYERIGTMDITTCRNAYGRQLGSFFTVHDFKGAGHPLPMSFIRAPYIEKVGDGVEVLAEVDGHIVAARQGNQLVTAFHPELNDETFIHQLFVDMVRESVSSKRGSDIGK